MDATILFWGAAICFLIDAFKGALGWSSSVGFTALAFALLTFALWLVG